MPEWLDITVKIIGAVGVISGIFFTGCQVKEGARTNAAKLTYEIQRDGRNLMEKVAASEAYVACIYKSDCSAQRFAEAVPSIREVMQFWYTVYRQNELKALPLGEWSEWKTELCDYTSVPPVVRFIDTYGQSYGSGFMQEVKSCKNMQ